MASLVDGTRLAFPGGCGELMVFVRDDARCGEGFGLTLAPDAPFLPFGSLGLPLTADAPCWAAPPFFVLRVMMELWSVRVLDSKNKLLRFVQPFFAMKNFAPVPTGKKHFLRL
jgi:hypothetical protein